MKERAANRGHLATTEFPAGRIDEIASNLAEETILQFTLENLLPLTPEGPQTLHIRDVTAGGGFAAEVRADVLAGGHPVPNDTADVRGRLTPQRAVEVVKEAASLASIPRTQPSDDETYPLIPDLSSLGESFPELYDQLRRSSPADWPTIADLWLGNRTDLA